MHVVEAALTFFNMNTKEDTPTKNFPPLISLQGKEVRKEYFHSVIDKFIEDYILLIESANQTEDDSNSPSAIHQDDNEDKVNNYAVHLLKSFITLEDFRDAVREGNGERLASLSKELLLHFKSIKGFNAYAIEMFINIMQNDILLSEKDSHQAKWAATTNWTGGQGKNIEIDLMQENSNCCQKNLIKSMGANKTEKAILRASRASGGIKEITENIDKQLNITSNSAVHTHKSSQMDEHIILADLRDLRPFNVHIGRVHKSFPNIHKDPLHNLNKNELDIWITRHKKKLVLGIPCTSLGDEDEGHSDSDAD